MAHTPRTYNKLNTRLFEAKQLREFCDAAHNIEVRLICIIMHDRFNARSESVKQGMLNNLRALHKLESHKGISMFTSGLVEYKKSLL